MGVRQRGSSRHASTGRIPVSARARPSERADNIGRLGVRALFGRGSPGRLGTILRLAGGASVGTMGGIHLNLWSQGYRSVPTIGALFLVNAGLALAVMVALAAWPRRVIGLAGAALSAGTLAGYLVSVFHGLFGFRDTFSAPLAVPAIAAEAAGIVLLGCWAALAGQATAIGKRP